VDARIVELSAADQAEAGGLPGADDVSTAPADPRAFSDVEMGIDDDLRAMRLAGQATRADRDV
jgi:hypothetical protein